MCKFCPKRVFLVENAKIAFLRASMVRSGAHSHNGILMSLLLLVAETIKVKLC